MTDKYLFIDTSNDNQLTAKEALVVSDGSEDAGRIVATDDSGKLDKSVIPMTINTWDLKYGTNSYPISASSILEFFPGSNITLDVEAIGATNGYKLTISSTASGGGGGDGSNVTTLNVGYTGQQNLIRILRKQTIDATNTLLTFDALSHTTSNQLKPPSDSVWFYCITVVGRNITNDSDMIGMKLSGIISKSSSAGSITLLSNQHEVFFKNSNTWNAFISMDTINDIMQIYVTGEAGKTINWVAKADITEVIG